jgi:hypothetical protein
MNPQTLAYTEDRRRITFRTHQPGQQPIDFGIMYSLIHMNVRLIELAIFTIIHILNLTTCPNGQG